MKNWFLVTFDAQDAYEGFYDDVYCWAHSIGGTRYFLSSNGRSWVRYASTTVKVPLEATTCEEAAKEFSRQIRELLDVRTDNITVAKGDSTFVFWTTAEDSPPDYIESRNQAGLRFSLAKLRRKLDQS